MCTCEPGYCEQGACFVCRDLDSRPAECVALLEDQDAADLASFTAAMRDTKLDEQRLLAEYRREQADWQLDR